MQCKICHHLGDHDVYQVKELMMGIGDTHTYFQCEHCHCLQIESPPDNLPDYYPENYYSYQKPTSESGFRANLVKARDRYAVNRDGFGGLLEKFMPNPKLRTLRPLGLTPETRILDVGCGAGILLHSLREIGYSNTFGIDPFNEKDIQYDNGLEIAKRDLFSEDHIWDVIMFHHSFEHLPEQQATLSKAYDCLAPGGTVLIRIPTVSSYAWQHYQECWSQLDAPRHLFLHSKESVRVLASETGFKLTKVQYDSNAFQFWGSEQYLKNITLRSPESYAENPEKSPFTKKQIRQFEQRSKNLNDLQQGDQAAFYLSKIST